jgi:hypothetical protein
MTESNGGFYLQVGKSAPYDCHHRQSGSLPDGGLKENAMQDRTQNTLELLQASIDKASRSLSASEYRELLEELECDCEARRLALDDDEHRDEK